MNELTHDDKLFCDTFVKTFDFDESCIASSSDKVSMAGRFADEEDFVHIYIRNSLDTRRLSNKFITKDLIRNELINIVMTQDVKYKINAAKLLLGIEDSPNKVKEFKNLINAITRDNNTE